MPQRIQRKRTKGWRMPPKTVYVGRPSLWGNPLVVGEKLASCLIAFGWPLAYIPADVHPLTIVTPENIIPLFEAIARLRQKAEPDWLVPLGGKDESCWCPASRPCHADVLLRLANEPTQLASEQVVSGAESAPKSPKRNDFAAP